MIKHKDGDVTKETVIAHCISCDCAMGAGVVVPICKKHPDLKNACKEYARVTKPSALGTAYRYQDEHGTVYNLFSKTDVREHAGYIISYEQYLKQLEACLYDVARQMQERGETSISMPLIGCGLDRCEWKDVEPLIEKVFPPEITVTVCHFGRERELKQRERDR